MIANPAFSHPAAPDDVSAYAEEVRHRLLLNEMMDLGMALARQVCAPQTLEAGASVTEVSVAYDRITRAVRRSILLARQLAEPAVAPSDAVQRRVAARRQVLRGVEDAIREKVDDPEQGARLEAELRERLDGPDLADEIEDRPAAEIVAEICRDLGIGGPPGTRPPWKRRTPSDIVTLCARASAGMDPRDPTPGRAADMRLVASADDG